MTEWQMKDGDLIPDGAGGFALVHGEQAVLQRVLFKLTARRGAFPFLPELGSRLHTLGREKPSVRQSLCAQYVTEALEGEPVTVKEVFYTEENGRSRVEVRMDLQGQETGVSVQVGEVTDEDD